MNLNNIRERAEYYVTDSLESQVKSENYKQYFIGADGVYEVSHAQADDPALESAITADVAMIGENTINANISTETIDNVREFAFNMGVPYEEIDPGFNADGEYVNSVSYGELAEYEADLPDKIQEFAAKNGIAVLPIYQAQNDHLSTEPENNNYNIVGYISEKVDPNVSITDVQNDLREQVEMLDNIQFGDVYKVAKIDPRTKLAVEDQMIYGSDPDENGMFDIVDINNFLGHFSSIENAGVNNDLSALVNTEYDRVNGNDRYVLEAEYDARNSFYGKARVEMQNFVKTLYSYDTPVLALDTKTKEATRLIDDFTQTTARHAKEFLLQEGVDIDKMKGKSMTAKLATLPGRDYGENVKAVRIVHEALEQGKDVAKTKDKEKSKNDIDR